MLLGRSGRLLGLLGWLGLVLAIVKLGLEASLTTESKIVIDAISRWNRLVEIKYHFIWTLLWHRVRRLCLRRQHGLASFASLLLL